MLRSLLVLILFATSGLVHAQDDAGKSAHRAPGVSYKAYAKRARLMALTQQGPMSSPVDLAKPFDTAVLPVATVWENEGVLQERFERIRDHRFLIRDQRPDFLRRSSWLFPDDGCFARAQLAVRNLSQWATEVPKKIFVFGDLNVKTDNAPGGSVTWWYHVAPLVEVNGEKYVLDPAIEPKHPLKLREWLARQSDVPGQLEVAVCESGSYTPYDSCATRTDGLEKMAESDQGWYLDLEWERLQYLGRDPESELGDTPPWLEAN